MRSEYEFWAQVDSICDQFEEAWRRDPSARVEGFLKKLSADPRAPLLARELLTLERELRETAGESDLAGEFSRRFPEWADLLSELFDDSQSVHQRDVPTTAPSGDLGPDEGSPLEGYQLMEEIAEGGMGAIHRARDLALERDVAVKLIRPCFESYRAVRARFNIEAKVTGQLQHPGIPPVHSLGVLPDGRPYLAMKLIHGQTLSDVLNEHGSPADRSHLVRVFEQICLAVGYAHANGVIHRDLKPANVMVGEFGEVQVMDWGLAKVLGAEELKVPNFTLPEGAETRPGDAMGTLQYMAPEQAAGKLSELDPRTDVFGLGAILCEILTGAPPIQGKTLAELKRRAEACDLGDTVESLQQLANGSMLPELAVLCGRCLAADPQDRFENGAAVAEEVSRINLATEERARKAEQEKAEALVRERESFKRRRVWTYATVMVITVLTVGVVATTASAIYANRQKTLANQAFEAEAKRALAEQRAKEEAQLRLAQIEKSNRVLGDVFQDLNVRQNGLGDVPIQEVLAQRLVSAAKQIDGEAIGDPLVVATMQNRLALTLVTLDRFKEAITLLEKSHATCLDILGSTDEETTAVARNLAVALHYDHQWAPAAERLRDVLTIQRDSLGTDHLGTAQTMESLGTTLTFLGRHEEAIELFEEAIKIQSSNLGEKHHSVLLSRLNLAAAHRENGDWAESLKQLQGLHPAFVETLDKEHPDLIGVAKELAVAHLRVGEHAAAAEWANQALALATEKLGPNHSLTIHCRFAVGSAMLAMGQLQEAMPELEASLQLMKERLGEARYETAVCMCELAMGHMKAGHMEDAHRHASEGVQQLRQLIGADHPTTIYNTRQLARIHVESGDLDTALQIMSDVSTMADKQLGENHPISLLSQNDLAYILQAKGRMNEAIMIWEQVRPRMETVLGNRHRDTLTAAHNLASAYRITGQGDRASSMLESNYQARAEALGEDDIDTLVSLNELGVFYWSTGQYDKSVAAFESVLPSFEKKYTRSHRDTLMVIANLGLNYLAAGRADQGTLLLEEATSATDKNPELHLYLEPLIDAYGAAGNPKVKQAVGKLLPWAKPQLQTQPVRWSGMLAKCSAALLQADAAAEAAPLLEECLEIRKKIAPTFWLTYNTMSMLGAAYLGKKQFDQAEPLLMEGYEGLKEHQGDIPLPARIRLVEAVQRLIDLHSALDREDEVAKWKSELAKIQQKLDLDLEAP